VKMIGYPLVKLIEMKEQSEIGSQLGTLGAEVNKGLGSHHFQVPDLEK
jgi:hypothetical protein